MPDKKLFLLDAYALIYRAYFAFSKNPRITTTGINTSAIFGFTNTLLEILNKEKPTHIAVVFDTAAPTNRHEEFTEYKANRQEIPNDIVIAIPYIQKILNAFRIPVMFSDGYEADDIIGTLAKKAEEHGFLTYMMTPDKDFGQLVSENIFIYKPAYMGSPSQILGVAEVCKKFEITSPLQVIDILGLWGDAIDNIPGIPGVGEKTAKQLIAQFGSIENLLENTDKLTGKLKERVEQNKEQALLSKRLATIDINVPVAFDEAALIMEEPDKEALKQLFSELEFRNLAQRVLGEAIEIAARPMAGGQTDLFSNPVQEEEKAAPAEAPCFKTIHDIEHNYHCIDTREKREELIKILSAQNSFCFDTETTGLDVHTSELVGLSFCWKNSEAYYVPLPHGFEGAKQVVHEFKAIFENPETEKIGQNLKYDIAILSWYGVNVKGKLFDTMLAHYILQPDMKHGMDVLSTSYLNYAPISIETLIGKKGKKQLSMRDVPLEHVVKYAAEDADVTLQLKHIFDPMLNDVKCRSLFTDVEMNLVPVLASMEREGVSLDIPALNDFSLELEKELQQVEQDIYKEAGTQFNISSPRQLGDILFEYLKIDAKGKKTRTGQYSTGEEVLSKLVNKHPVVQKVLDYRQLQKLKSTYVDALPSLVNPRTGRLHTTYNQAVAATGRLSSNNPNLQNIPIRTEKGREVRKAFVARNREHVLIAADYSQIELRIIAALSNDEAMIEAFVKGQDIHTATAAKVFGVSIDEVTKDMRSKAKMVNFGIIYGISAFGLSERLNIPRKEAAQIIEQYFVQYPAVKNYMQGSITFAREKGYVETLLGRRRYLRDINSGNAIVRGFAERNAINAPIQGTAADMIKVAMINIHREMEKRNLQSRMILQVHDELIFDAYRDEVDVLKEIITDKMRSAMKMAVPLEVEIGIGENWLLAH